MKKALTILLALTMVLMLFAACGTPAEPAEPAESEVTSTATSEAPAESTEKIVVEVWHMFAEDTEPTSASQRYQAWAEDFNATNEHNIEVVVSGAKTADVILTTIASGEKPDIFQNFWNNAPTWADNGAILDLSDYVANSSAEWDYDDFMPAAWDLAMLDGKTYSIPFSYSSTFMFYDKDMLAAAGYDEFPATMDELAQCIRDLTVVEADGTITQMGMIPDYPWLDNVMWPVAFNAPYLSEDGATVTFDDPAMLEAYQFVADIYAEYGYDNIKRFQESLGARATNEDSLFTGQTPIRWQSDSGLASMVEAATATETNMGIAPMPAPTEGDDNYNMLTGGVWQVNAKTENPDATWIVMESMTSKETMAMLAEGDHNNGTFMSRTSAIEAIKDMEVSQEAKDVADLLLTTTARPFPMCGFINEYLGAIGTQMNEVLLGNQTVEEAAANVVAEIQPLADAG